MNGGDLIKRTNALKLVMIALPLWLAGCVASVSYGDVRHTDYVVNERCDPRASAPVTTDPATITDKPFFFVTSRLPDCRTADVQMLHHRGDKVRFGRFAAPQDSINEKGKVDGQHIPLTISNDARWWAELSKAMENREGRVLVYVHGFRETFFSSSRDTVQIERLTGFKGPVVQYSWPSQGDFLKYVADETNMYWDERNFRQFLTKLAQQPSTKEIVLVSHSLGARLVLPAVEFVDRTAANSDSSVVSNIILVSPDVDRQDFERGIAEEVLSARRVNNNRRITVYVSAKDRALSLSDDIHGYPRLGRPDCFDPFEAAELTAKGLPERCYAAKFEYDVPPEKSGLTIVDTTPVSRGRTGHSDYLRSAAVCSDFAAVVNDARDGGKDRIPTYLSYVYTFAPPAKDDKPDDDAICRRDTK